MKPSNKARLGRKAFVSGTLLAATSLAACKAGQKAREGIAGEPGPYQPEFYKVLSPTEYDRRAMLAVIQVDRPHKQVFSASVLGLQPSARYAALFAHMQFAMNGYDFSLGGRRGKLATLGVMSGQACLLSLTDAMWTKYRIGRLFDAARTNVYWVAKSNLDLTSSPNDPHGVYQDWSAEAVRRRGGTFMVCHTALTKIAMRCASENGSDGATVLSDLVSNLRPGCLLVPSGVTAVQLAQEHGWKLYTIA